MFVSTLYRNEDFILQEVSEGFTDYKSASSVQIGEADQKLGIKHVQLGGKKCLYGKNVIGLDTMAEISIFRRSLMLDERDCDPVVVNGVKKGSSSIFISKIGTSVIGVDAYVSDEAVGNILSFAQVKDQCGDRVRFNAEKDQFDIQIFENGEIYHFRRSGQSNLYLCNLGDRYHRTVQVTTVAEKMKLYTKREISGAVKARALQRRLGFVSTEQLLKMIGNGMLLRCDIGKRDVLRAVDIFGQDIGELKGKATAKKAPVIRPDEKIQDNMQREDQECHCDIMFVNKRPFLISVFLSTEYVMVNRIKSRSSKDICSALRKQMSEMSRLGFRVTMVRVDGESGVGADEETVSELARAGVAVDIVGATEAVAVAERKIRSIKDRCRCVVNTLPFALSNKLEDCLVLWATSRVNLQVTTNSSEWASPTEKVYNRKVDIIKDAKHGFGDYVQVYSNDTNNSLNERTRGAIAVMPTGNMDGSWYYYTLDNGGIIRRLRAKQLPMPEDVIARLNLMANTDGAMAKGTAKRGKYPEFVSRWTSENDEYESLLETHTSSQNTGFPEGISSVERIRVIQPAEIGMDAYAGGLEEELEVATPEIPTIVSYETVAAEEEARSRNWVVPGGQIETGDSNEVAEDDNMLAEHIVNEIESQSGFNTQPEESSYSAQDLSEGDSDIGVSGGENIEIEEIASDPPQTSFHMKLRSQRAQPGRWSRRVAVASLENQLSSLKTPEKNMSVKQALSRLGETAEAAIIKELNMIMVEKEAFEGVHMKDLSYEQRKSVIPSKMFIREKYNALGEHEKTKARLVAGGHRQDRSVFDSVSSGTVSTSSVFMVAAIAAVEKRSVCVIDFPGAYLNSPLPEDHPNVYMRIDKELSAIACKIVPGFQEYIREDGSSVVKLKKALYGCVQSSLVWYNTLTNKLKTLGYSVNDQDVCVMNKIDSNGNQVTIVIHVDDIMLTAKNDDAVEDELRQLKAAFGELTVNRGPVVNYLGMNFDFRQPEDGVKITMSGFVDEFLNDMDKPIPGIAKTPAGRDLFTTGDSESVTAEQKEFFHSTVARLLYLGKRVRPDILVAVSYLAKRVQKPNTDDFRKMERAVRYLRGSRELGIVISATTMIQVLGYIDASHAVHEDHKGHTGCIISLGRGPIYAKSGSQRINSKSSTESELIGLSDSASQVLWTRNFLISQGYTVGPSAVYQDNTSCMSLVKNGKSNSERTRHIATRFYFVKDRVDSKEIRLEYLQTHNMIADILTKPLQGELFFKLRKILLNWP